MQTTDISIAATLQCHGLHPDIIERHKKMQTRDNKYIYRFVFETDSEKAELLEKEYYRGSVMINPIEYEKSKSGLLRRVRNEESQRED